MSFTYLFFFLFFLFSFSTPTGVHAQTEDGSTNPIDTNEPPARLVCFVSHIYLPQSNHISPIFTKPFFFFASFGLSPNLKRSNIAQVTMAGCAALVIYDNNAYHRLCWDTPVTIYPHSDGIYRITIYTGFPFSPSSILSAAPAKTHPEHAQYYEWWGYRNLFVGLDGCLRVCE